MKFQNCLFLKKITFGIFRGMKTTTVPEIVFLIFIVNNTSLIEKYNPFLMRKQYLIYVAENYKTEHVKLFISL